MLFSVPKDELFLPTAIDYKMSIRSYPLLQDTVYLHCSEVEDRKSPHVQDI